MARGLTAADLRKLADEIDAAEAAEDAAGTKEQQTAAQARLEALEERYDRLEKLYIEQGGTPPADDDDDDQDDEPAPKPKKKQKPAPAPKPTRPGRRNGQAYDWDVDDDGNVIRLDVATVFSGEDEPDEVELPDDDSDD